MSSFSLKFAIEKLQQQPYRMTKRIREHGLGYFIGWLGYQAAWRRHERKLKIDTMEHAYGINVWGQDGGQWYDPIDYRCLWSILDYMNPNPDQDVFLDYGAGLGRPIINAAMRPFKRVIGVENNELLLDYCRKHIDAAAKRGKYKCPIDLVDQSAADFDLPDDVSHILMHNAFVEQDLTNRVLEKIRQSLERKPRPLMLVFVPLLKHQHFLDGCDFLKYQKDIPTGYWDHVRIMLYQHSPN